MCRMRGSMQPSPAEPQKRAWRHCQVEVQELCDWQSKKLQEQFYYRRAGKAGVCRSHQCSDTKQRPAPGTKAGGKAQSSVPGSGAEPAAHERRAGTHRDRPDR